MNDNNATRQALADKIRHGHRDSVRRRRTIIMILVVIAVLSGGAVLVWFQLQPGSAPSEAVTPEHTTEDFGFRLTPAQLSGDENLSDASVEVALFDDFLCPSCKLFQTESGPFLSEEVTAGNINLIYYPFAFLLNNSTDEYSQRAANAAVCVGDQAGSAAYARMHELLLSSQPAQGGAGLTDAQLIDFGADSGAGDITDCVDHRVFTPWVEQALSAGQRTGVTSTPTIRVNGMTVVRDNDGRESMPGPDELRFAIEAQQ